MRVALHSFIIPGLLSHNRYAQQARTIVNVARINEDPNAAIIRGELKLFTRTCTVQCCVPIMYLHIHVYVHVPIPLHESNHHI